LPEPEATGSAMIGRKIAGFTIKSLIATGGMGSVYVAVQEKPRRRVALKLMRAGVASRSALRRFEFESQILARLNHPNIAQVYEAGTHDDGTGGVPYFAMEYVAGARSITEYASTNGLSTTERLQLFVKVCEAIQHGHQKGIIHRDLKPTNILVDAASQPKIIDFGVARATDSDIAVTTLQTDVGELIGTLQYMSPEQCAGEADSLDTRSDVYSLGVVLYYLLCDAPPYDVSNASIIEAAKVIQERPPARLSSINRTLRGDVETITLKALEKARNRRYKSAEALGDDVQRYLDGQTITAHPPSMIYQLGRFARRNKALVGGLVAVFAALAVGMTATSLALVRALRAEEDARGLLARAEGAEVEATRRAKDLERVARFQSEQLSGIDVDLMGERIREDVVSEVAAAMELSGADPETIVGRTTRLRETLGVTSFRGVAVAALNENIFDGAIKALDEEFSDQPLVRARLLQSLAATMRGLDLDERCAEMQTEALEIRRRELGETHPDTLESLWEWGWLLARAARWGEAEGVLRRCLAGRRVALGELHPDTLATMRDLAYFLYAQQKKDEAEQLGRAAVDGYMKLHGPDHVDTIGAMQTMGVVASARGDNAETERWMRAAYEGYQRVLGPEDRLTLDAAVNLVGPMTARGMHAEAEALMRETLTARQRVHGPNDKRTLMTCLVLSRLLQGQGRLVEAERYARLAAEGYRRVHGVDHHDTLASFNSHGVLLLELERYADAERAIRDLLDQTRVSGRESYRVAHLESLLGQALTRLGRYGEAEPLVLQGYEHIMVARAGDPQQRARSAPVFIVQIVHLYEAWGKPDKAAEWRAKLEEVTKDAAGEESSKTDD
jgi:non-specific serine/threonine protein kinase/serine/threonine-protein kinase